MCDIFFGIEHRLRKRKHGDLRLMRRESPMKGQAVRIESRRQEEFLLQATATWEELLERKKEQLRQSQETRVELPRFG